MLSLIPLAQLIGDYEGNGHMDWGGGHMDWGGGWWIVTLIVMILFGGLVAYWLMREFGSSRRDQRQAPDSEDALTILDRRLVDGSITPDEYRERRAILTGTDSSESDPGKNP